MPKPFEFCPACATKLVDGEDAEEQTEEIAPGESAELSVELADGEYELYCPIGNHRDQRIEGTLVVSAGATGRHAYRAHRDR